MADKIDSENPDGYEVIVCIDQKIGSCDGCAFVDYDCIDTKCSPLDRKDGKHVIFKKKENKDEK